jgi:alkanesulfonate monooxygenase SsuD/methylene tetrahydromethanopterin reductase-like flavin-dependent oxidoreductase (luciferase family)
MQVADRGAWLERVGVVLTPIGVSYDWWRDAATRLDAAGYAGLWTWDHLASRGTGRSVLEAWTTLAGVAAVTRRATLGTMVTNVMVRHPALLARIVATLQEASGGRVVVGLGIGGDPKEHRAYGIPLPPAAERVARLEEAVAVMRALWGGRPVSRDSPFFPLRDAIGLPAPDPIPPIVVAGQSTAGARMAARVGDAWTTRPDLLDDLLPRYRAACAEAGRDAGRVIVHVEGPRHGVDYVAGTGWASDPEAELAAWRRRGADEVVLTARTAADVDALLEAARGR